MAEKSELILQVHMNETRQSWDGKMRGSFAAYVYAKTTDRRYEGTPTTTLWAYDSVWARFALNACYGHPELQAGRAYGFEYGYEPEGPLVRPQDLDRMTKGLRKAEKGYAKLCGDYGRPQSLGQEVVYVMRALGITHACWKRPEGNPGYGEYRDWHVVRTMEEVRYHIDSTIEAFRQRHLDAQAA